MTHERDTNQHSSSQSMSAEGDLMITGPALCMYFAALRCTTNPPSVPLPRPRSKSTTSTSSARQNSNEPHELSYDNCPPAFVSFLRVWAETVPSIQALVTESQHDLARVTCGLSPLSASADSSSSQVQEHLRTINGITADLQAAALDASTGGAGGSSSGSGSGTESPRRTMSFVPPPMYDESVGAAPPPPPPAATNTAGSSTMQMHVRSVTSVLQPDKTRAYFACVAFAILHVATTSVNPKTGAVRGVLGKELTLGECPRELQPFMRELGEIGREARRMMEEDDEWAIRMVQEGREDELSTGNGGAGGRGGSRMDRVRGMLEEGVGYELRAMANRPNTTRSRRSVEGRAVAFANRINGLSLGMTKLRAFRERQEDVFAILGAAG
ncbi:hypothetical protein CPC08DRAFT_745166 [Agrocybe pediades]|nr:hypothetical protein CPC08DRAFT_745166 [Agrocybe pediades]